MDAAYQSIVVSTLALNGLKKICFVDMTKNNVLFDARLKVAGEEEKVLQLVKNHSNLKIMRHRIRGTFQDRILCDLLGPIEKRVLLIWDTFEFDDDALNRKYKVGRYYDDQETESLLQRVPPIILPNSGRRTRTRRA